MGVSLDWRFVYCVFVVLGALNLETSFCLGLLCAFFLLAILFLFFCIYLSFSNFGNAPQVIFENTALKKATWKTHSRDII